MLQVKEKVWLWVRQTPDVREAEPVAKGALKMLWTLCKVIRNNKIKQFYGSYTLFNNHVYHAQPLAGC